MTSAARRAQPTTRQRRTHMATNAATYPASHTESFRPAVGFESCERTAVWCATIMVLFSGLPRPAECFESRRGSLTPLCLARRFALSSTQDRRKRSQKRPISHIARGNVVAHSECGGIVVARCECGGIVVDERSEEHTSELQSHLNLVCR